MPDESNEEAGTIIGSVELSKVVVERTFLTFVIIVRLPHRLIFKCHITKVMLFESLIELSQSFEHNRRLVDLQTSFPL
jgi:hypothetical protein